MKFFLLFLTAFAFSSILYGQYYATLRLGSTDVSNLVTGDTVTVPIYCDDISNTLIMGYEFTFSCNPNVIYPTGEIQNQHPNFSGCLFHSINFLYTNEVQLAANWLDPSFTGNYINPGEIFFEWVFTYQGGETPLTWYANSTLYNSIYNNYTVNLIDGCVCHSVPYGVIFHVISGGANLEGANVTIGNESKTTNSLGNAAFALPDGNYSYTVTKPEFITQAGSLTVAGASQIIEVVLVPVNTYPVTFSCDVSCENQFNGWNVVINDDTLASGETIYLPAGDWDYKIAWLECWLEEGIISVQGPITIDCSFIGIAEPHATFHVFSSQGGDIEDAIATVGPYTLMTNLSGEAGFCLPGGDHYYTISKQGYDTISGIFSYTNFCQDTLIDILMNIVNVENLTSAEFRFYPNPSNGKFHLEPSAFQGTPMEVQVTDLTGRVIYTGYFEKTIKILLDLSEQKTGIYFMQVKSGPSILNKKLVIH